MKRILRFGVAMLVVLGLAACAEVPEEAVTLSVTVGQDLEEVRRAHRELAVRYFARSKQDIHSFIDETYRPVIVRDTMERLDLLQRLEEQMNKTDGQPLDFMQLFVERTIERIETTRRELLQPVEERETEVLTAIDDSYANLQNAHAIVTGHLASVRRVQQAQEELLADAGLKDLRGRVIDNAAALSDKIGEIVVRARKGESKLDDMTATVTELKELLEKPVGGG